MSDQEEETDDEEFGEEPAQETLRFPPQDWIAGSRSVYWGRWRWPIEVLNDAQAWGDSHGLRLVVVSEEGNRGCYNLKLYIAPKPNRSQEGLTDYRVKVRDEELPKLETWLEGYLAAKGLLQNGEDVRHCW